MHTKKAYFSRLHGSVACSGSPLMLPNANIWESHMHGGVRSALRVALVFLISHSVVKLAKRLGWHREAVANSDQTHRQRLLYLHLQSVKLLVRVCPLSLLASLAVGLVYCLVQG